MIRTSNPVFTSDTYQDAPAWMGAMTQAQDKPRTMSITGTAWKTLYLLAITIVTAAVSWNIYQNNPGYIMPTIIGSVIGGFVSWILIIKMHKLAPLLVPIFAFMEGLFVAAISIAIVEYSPLAQNVGGEAAALAMVGQAAGISLAITAAMLFGYASGVLRLGPLGMKIVAVMVGGVAIYYLGSFMINMIGGSEIIPRIDYSDSPIGIGFSVIVIVLASLMLLLDFRFVEEGVQRGLPKSYEWIGAFGILTTVVWLYVEVLKLLAKFNRE